MTRIEQIRNNFMKETYQDTWRVYQSSINNENFDAWNYIILTASNKEQAETYKREIEFRLSKKLLPSKSKYLVLEDPEGKRVGSRRCNSKCFTSYKKRFWITKFRFFKNISYPFWW